MPIPTDRMRIKKFLDTLQEQKTDNFLDYIDWIFWGPRASGRSYWIAMVAIRRALVHPEMWVEARDHHTVARSEARMIDTVARIISKDSNLKKLHFDFSSTSFRYVPMVLWFEEKASPR